MIGVLGSAAQVSETLESVRAERDQARTELRRLRQKLYDNGIWRKMIIDGDMPAT